MGYDVHITLADDWGDSSNTPIALDRWLQYVESDPDMRLDGYAEASTPDGTLRYENEGLAVWTTFSGHDVNGNRAWFDYRDGRIVVKNPDDEILTKMISIANALGANVIGDEGERYPEPDKPRAPEGTATPNRPWWRFW